MIEETGYLYLKRGMIGYIEFHDEDTRTTIYEPTEEEIERACREHDVNYNALMKVIRNRHPEVHAILIKVDVFRDAEGSYE